MRHRLLLLLSCLSLAACSRPSQTEMFIRADKADGGVYSFPVEMTDSLASYDFWFYSRLFSGSIGNLELRVSWTAPSGESFYETVYMEKVDSHGVRELYRSGVVPAEYGEWKLNVRPVDPVKDFLGLGLVTIRNDGTR